MVQKIKSFFSWVYRHKYAMVFAAFLLIIGVLDNNNLIRQAKLWNEERVLKNEVEYYNKELAKTRERLNELDADSGAIERVARERYMMKKPNEDIFVFEEDLKK